MATYADGTTRVLPGDRVSVRFLLRRRRGEAIYVPRVSKKRGTYEHSGLTGSACRSPTVGRSGKSCCPRRAASSRACASSAAARNPPTPRMRSGRLDQQESEEQAESVQPDERPVATPGPVDWFCRRRVDRPPPWRASLDLPPSSRPATVILTDRNIDRPNKRRKAGPWIYTVFTSPVRHTGVQRSPSFVQSG